MAFLADENLPLEIVHRLKKENFDIVSLSELRRGMGDEEVLFLAKEEKRTLITFDKDFSEMIFRRKEQSHGVIFLRIHPQNPDYIYSVLKKVLSKKILFGKSFCVVEHRRMRVLPLPYNVME